MRGLAIAILALLFGVQSSHAGKLARARAVVSGQDSGDEEEAGECPEDHRETDEVCSTDDCGAPDGELVVEMLEVGLDMAILLADLTAESARHDHRETRGGGAAAETAHLSRAGATSPGDRPPSFAEVLDLSLESTARVAPVFVLGSSYGYDIDGLHRPGLDLAYYPLPVLGVEAGYAHYIEPVGRGLDHMPFGDAKLMLRTAVADLLLLRGGAGFNWTVSESRPQLGPGVSAGAELFPASPVVVGGDLNLGVVGAALALQGQVRVALRQPLWALSVGAEVLHLVSGAGSVTFLGPQVGLELRL